MFNQPNQFDLLAQLNGNDFLAATAGLGGLGTDLAQLTALAQLNPSFNALFQQQLLNLSTAGVLPPPPAGPSAAAAAAAQPTKAQLNAALSAFMGSQAPPLSAPSNHLPSHGSSSSLASANTYMPSASNNNNNNNASHGKSTNANYQKLLQMIDEISKDIKPSYLGNKNSTERLKRAVASARILIKDCQVECERNTKN